MGRIERFLKNKGRHLKYHERKYVHEDIVERANRKL